MQKQMSIWITCNDGGDDDDDDETHKCLSSDCKLAISLCCWPVQPSLALLRLLNTLKFD